MTENQKPWQLAIGGGEPTIHLEFIELLKTSYDMGITPNFTTNGMYITDELLEATEKYCGGVAISCHPHLEKHWKNAVEQYHKLDIKLNLHIIISDKSSVDRFEKIYNMYRDKIDYFVLLPHTKKGRAEEKTLEHKYLFDLVDTLKTKQVAFGALFHPYLKDNKNRFGLSLYEPEIMSKYISFEGNGLMYKSSFCDEPIREGLFLKH
jgi:MoaA/NifB/PqqE/SkfB family radical SAM enzyme